jgi:hypothetical protein
MSALSDDPNFPGRIYSNNDVHAASMVWLDRRTVIEQLVINEAPHLNRSDVRAIISGCSFYATCSESMFEQVTKRAEP